MLVVSEEMAVSTSETASVRPRISRTLNICTSPSSSRAWASGSRVSAALVVRGRFDDCCCCRYGVEVLALALALVLMGGEDKRATRWEWRVRGSKKGGAVRMKVFGVLCDCGCGWSLAGG